MDKKKKRRASGEDAAIRLSTLIYGFLLLAVIFLAVVFALLSITSNRGVLKFAAGVSRIIPLPAAILNYNNIVTLDTFEKNAEAVEKFYEGNGMTENGVEISLSSEKGQRLFQIRKKELLNKLIEDRAIELIARKMGVAVSMSDIDKAFNDKLKEYGTTKNVQDDLAKSYGWSMNDFKQEILIPLAYKNALAALVEKNDLKNQNDAQKGIIEKAKAELDSGESFEDVVRQYSQGLSKNSGGQIGWIKKGQLVPELQEFLFGPVPPKKNAIVESALGFHIVSVDDKKKENGEDVVSIRQIFVPKKTFADWLEEKMKNMSIAVPLHGMTWSSSDAEVNFSTKAMADFQEQINEKNKNGSVIVY